ncbi:DoxX family protein [Actinoplanes sp. DH11]|uniref:DoxX family protein n=1 Tax=Actinoplanes sp. DH11 TaxID=2857011 RepID=UPI001E43F105|nr:DoxX family protein [Actinoplanes sp. DH11]
MFIAIVVLSVLLALVFAAVGIAKITGNERQLKEGGRLGFSARSYRIIGGLDLAGAAGVLIGLFWAPLGLAAAAGLLLMMAGAVVFQARGKQTTQEMSPAIMVGAMAAGLLVLHILRL